MNDLELLWLHLRDARSLYEMYSGREADPEKAKYYKGMANGLEIALAAIDTLKDERMFKVMEEAASSPVVSFKPKKQTQTK